MLNTGKLFCAILHLYSLKFTIYWNDWDTRITAWPKGQKKPDGFHYLKAIRLRPVTILRIPIWEAGPIFCAPPLKKKKKTSTDSDFSSSIPVFCFSALFTLFFWISFTYTVCLFSPFIIKYILMILSRHIIINVPVPWSSTRYLKI